MLWETVPWAVFRWGWGWAGNSNLSARGDSGIGLIVWALGGLKPHSAGRELVSVLSARGAAVPRCLPG